MYVNANHAFAEMDASLARDSFPTKSAQKDALSCCQQAIDHLHRWVQETLLSNKDENNDFIAPNGNEQYYWSAGCHKWNAKVEALFADHPEFVAAARIIVGKYLTIKAMPVTPPTKANELERRVEREIADIIAQRGAQIEEAVRLHDLFKQLNVYATWHYVTNQYGTTFRRFQYFMNGERVALLTILGAMSAIEQKELKDKLAAKQGAE
jgi:hypothetical protein